MTIIGKVLNNWTIRRLWLEAMGFPWWSHYEIADGRLPKRCYLCGREEDWLLDLRKMVPIYGEVQKYWLSHGIHVLFWCSTETQLANVAKDESDCVREICMKPSCWFNVETKVTDVRTGELVTIPARPASHTIRMLSDLIIDCRIYGYATLRFLGLSIQWIFNALQWKIYQWMK